jgi:P-type E1-E2 ATPase
VLNVIEAGDGSPEKLLAVAASAESAISSHPLARAVLDAAAERGLRVVDPDAAEVVSGNGVVATVGGRRVTVGNERFMRHVGLSVPTELDEVGLRCQHDGHTLAYVAIDGEIRGFFGFIATPRPAARTVVDGLRRFGLEHVVMLTGDHARPAQAIADTLGLEVVAEASPQAKLDEVARWKTDGTRKRPRTVLMVGDGINDAGALAAADVGIAMGTAGADVAASAADIVIHGDHFSRVLTAAKLARHGFRMIRVNIQGSVKVGLCW